MGTDRNNDLDVIAVEGPAKRRHRSKQERRQIAEESLQPGASVAVLARRHGVNANQVFHWRKLLREGRLDVNPIPAQFMPVRIAEVIEEKSGTGPSTDRQHSDRSRRSAHSRRRFGRSHNAPYGSGATGPVISLPSSTSIWIAAGVTDMRRGFSGLSAVAQTVLEQNPYSGHVFVFRGKRGDLVKVLWWDGDGLCLFAKRLERGRFVWPQADNGVVSLSRAQLAMLLEGIDWRRPIRTAAPSLAV